MVDGVAAVVPLAGEGSRVASDAFRNMRATSPSGSFCNSAARVAKVLLMLPTGESIASEAGVG